MLSRMLSPCLLLASATAAPLSQNHGPKWEAKNAKNTLAAAAPLDDTKCVTYLSLADDSSYVGSTGVEWCEKNCPVGFCPEDRCTCVTAADVARKKKEEAGPHVSDAEKLKKMHTQLPRKVSPKISGPWFYVADGTGHEPMGLQRNELYGREVNSETVTGRKIPDWLASSKRSGNAVTLAFMDPKELDEPGYGVPNAFVEYTALLRNGTENRDRQVYFAIGGIAFSGFNFLSNEDTAQAAGKRACNIARAHSVGIEIDHETSSGNDVEGLKSFAKGFRQKCPMGEYPLSIDLMGSPSGGGLNWMKAFVEELIPEGSPGDPPPGNGEYFDFVNLMVIDGCQDASCLTGFWQMWEDYATLNFKRATLTFSANAICGQKDSDIVKEAAKFAKAKDAYGFRAWSVTPAGGGEWDPECDTAGAPGLQSMCEAVGGCK